MEHTKYFLTLAIAATFCLAMVALAGPAGAQTWIELTPAGTLPPASPPKQVQYDAANNSLIAFLPGNPANGGPAAEVWVLTNANGLGGTPTWIKLPPTGLPPADTGGESVVYDESSNRLIVYGGCFSSCGFAQSQVFVLSDANGLGGTPAWSQSSVTNPVSRVGHTAVFDSPNNMMIAFGGHLAFFGTDHNDTRFLNNANGTLSPSTWTGLFPMGTPPGIRSAHTAVYDRSNNRMIIFGGDNLIRTCCPYNIAQYNDVWVLANANGIGGTPTWMQLLPSGPLPNPRGSTGAGHGHSAVYDEVNNRMLVFGGVEWSNPAQDGVLLGDLWELSHANGLGGTPVWTQLSQSGAVPGPRFTHGAAFDSASQRMIAFGGRAGTGALQSNRVWVLILTQTVSIDIKPGILPNTIRLSKKGVTPVAILTTATFDAATVDPGLVCFGDAEDPTQRDCTEAHATGHIKDADGDGDLDLVLHYETLQTGIDLGDTHACLTGETFGGQKIEGCDSVITLP